MTVAAAGTESTLTSDQQRQLYGELDLTAGAPATSLRLGA